MRSSISNFKPPARWKRAPAWFLGAFAILVVFGIWLTHVLPANTYWRGRILVPAEPCIINEADSDHFGIYDSLYYGMGRAIVNARQADVLFLGNSRVLFAFRVAQVRSFSQSTGLRFFNLCFPANDGMVMAYETMERQGLRPSIVIINANGFFNLGCSPYGKETIREGFWKARLRAWGYQFAWNLRLGLHRIFPRFNLEGIYPAEPSVNYQAESDGCLLYENFSESHPSAPIRLAGSGDDCSPEELKRALWFKERLGQKGVQLVLTNIPYDVKTYIEMRGLGKAQEALALAPENLRPFRKSVQLAKALGVPLVVPPLEGLETMDGSHLTEKSAEKFAAGFFQGFGRLPMLRKLEASRKAGGL